MIKQLFSFLLCTFQIVISLRNARINLSMQLRASSTQRTILVLGGTGFVGSEVVQQASQAGFKVVSLSRRGLPSDLKRFSNEVVWETGSANEDTLNRLSNNYGPFYACVHAIGLLLDTESGLSNLNKFASGSGSVPSAESTYDNITRKTAFAAIESITTNTSPNGTPTPFIFISAAEAKWKFRVPVPWLEKYLIAKRAVEDKLLSTKTLRPVIFRPSLIWTTKRPQALASVIPFYIGNVFIPFLIDRPVSVENLVKAVVKSLDDSTISGIQTYKDIDSL